MTTSELAQRYDALRDLLVGSTVGLNLASRISPDTKESDFDSFVSTCYKATKEQLAADIDFFISAKITQRETLLTFQRCVYLLRTAKQHSDNDEAISYYNSWVGEPSDWHCAALLLEEKLEAFLTSLIECAARVQGSASLRKKWQDSSAVSTESIFDAVCRDLNCTFRPRARKAKIQNVESRYRRSGHQSKKRTITDFCVQEILSETDTLPMPHSKILDSMGYLGQAQAPALISLSYAIMQASPGLEGERFLRKVSESWWAISRD